MSDLSFMEKLLDGVDVEWKALGEVAIFLKGKSLPKTVIVECGTNKCIHYGELFTQYPAIIKKVKLRTNQTLESSVLSQSNDVLMPTSDVTPDGLAVASCLHEDGVILGGDILIIRGSLVDGNFLSHFIRNNKSKIMQIVKGSTVCHIYAKDLGRLQIPIPCPENPKKSLEIQAEIVRILDTFTSLTAELTAELTARKKQYNYYRDQLLSFKDGEVEWKTLGDVTKKWYSGGTPTAGNPKYYDDGHIPWLRTQEVKFSDIDSTKVKVTQVALDNSSAKWIPQNCVIIAISGATAGRSAINKIPLTTNQHCGCLEIDSSKALYRYVFHWVSLNHENIKALGQGARGDLNSSIIKNFKFPVPFANDLKKSLAEQARIVSILDKFDALTNSLTEGLPREIKLRQQQYEYYRDLLLSFPQSEEVEA